MPVDSPVTAGGIQVQVRSSSKHRVSPLSTDLPTQIYQATVHLEPLLEHWSGTDEGVGKIVRTCDDPGEMTNKRDPGNHYLDEEQLHPCDVLHAKTPLFFCFFLMKYRKRAASKVDT